MGRIRFNISKDSLIILNLTVYSETLEASLAIRSTGLAFPGFFQYGTI